MIILKINPHMQEQSRVQSHILQAPDFYVLGAAKSGTTAVWAWLRQHPDVFLPDVKEPGYFAYADGGAIPLAGPYDPDYVQDITTSAAEYEALYRAGRGKVTGDVSPVYLITRQAAARIAAVRPDARLVILLRDPVTRAFSQFLHNRRDGLEPCAAFSDALAQEASRRAQGWSWGHSYVANGRYADQISAYLDHFPREQILFFTFERLSAEPEACWAALCQHLGIATMPLPENNRVNATNTLNGVPSYQRLTRMIRHPGPVQRFVKSLIPASVKSRIRRRIETSQAPLPVLTPDLRAELSQQFDAERARIAALTGLSLDHWGTGADKAVPLE